MNDVLDTLIRLSVGVARDDWGDVRAAMTRLATSSCDPVLVDEAILQLYLFVGFPATLTAAGMWRDVSGGDPLDSDSTSVDSVESWNARGEELCRGIYGAAYERLRGNVAELHPALDRWMVMEGYGKVLGRPGLGLAERELCIIGMLAAGGWKRQLHSHLRGALRCGVGTDTVERALEIGLEASDPGQANELRDLWSEVRSSFEGDSSVH